jgi:hypothetical protein
MGFKAGHDLLQQSVGTQRGIFMPEYKAKIIRYLKQ